ncbi:bifunctional phosphoribosylaminoimidazolecarboxamide formyltransferase/IMP cyclohydrolase [Rhizorhabdus dicambivorans]|uniref:Bifunctional purine biosynthesis protein PurH n=1 Tax=Rhizorhabdus dicambivorans TaxID=1850238 RepID=A0A2A4FXG2_9SPHN|nr:bifunctional phosphoribosylaminoimidazolecarboxamide formyltransferase/IMP cyclohydrolase [Rhizorhabdus dicambivorans]ATE65295.1 bifunctional phosphoribosylaminoimidazolecarboxamide formyltransferase/IMP cyclohydrolase PurH [Rhizorhabdus dicambivorans]PCE42379.1 bifunctional phosphoribosylaminoimidazolecarboxamide formyltransferase/IMP cyclohydrolase PurH [Rhizorhabdus dicambivorans]
MKTPTTPAPDKVTIKRALLSVSDKSGLVELGQALAGWGVELVSTGGTAKALREAGLEVKDVSDITGFPEMMDGRVKTLHPMVHGGLLSVRDDPEHAKAMTDHGIGAIDLVVVNLYPFAQTVAKGAGRDEIIENIDIGGPSMVRSAAKNHGYVTIATDPADYAEIIASGGSTSLETRKRFAAKAFAATATYDAMISSWFAFGDQQQLFPEALSVPLRKAEGLRYGENPHQQAALYVPAGPAARGIAQATQIQGKELSYNNYNDADAALELVSEFRDGPPTVVIVKHANPCGVATADTLIEAYEAALACDSVSAFGGIIAVNRPLDGKTAEAISGIFTEVVAAPDADDDAKAVFARKKNLRLLLTGELPDPARGGLMMKTIAGGMLVQSRDNGRIGEADLKVVTKRAPTDQELKDCLFAWTVAKHVKSNAIVYAKGGATAGVGAGQMNRLESARIAAWKAKDAAGKAGWAEPRTIGSAVASDAFFPFADGLLAAVEAGATAVIQPGGSIRDAEVIAAADEAGLAMVFTNMRHFRH